MAENQEDRSREDLTEEASPYRLEEMRRKGQVAQSREVSAILALLAAGAVTYATAPQMGAGMLEFMREVFKADLSSRQELASLAMTKGFMLKSLRLTAFLALPICLAGFVMGILGSVSQVGFLFTAEPLSPDLSRLNPISGLRRLLGMKQLVEAVKLVFKVAVVLSVAYGLVKGITLGASAHLGQDLFTIADGFGSAAKKVFVALVAILAVFAGVDYGFQWFEFRKSVRMTKQEAKQEHKEREGDPQIRARIRAIQREVARRRMMQAVKKADVVVTNPTHIAIALSYQKSEMSAPKVVAKGADFLAQKIKQVAAEAGVPTVENVPLARTLYKTVKIGQVVPRPLYQAVAEVLAYVYRLKNRSNY